VFTRHTDEYHAQLLRSTLSENWNEILLTFSMALIPYLTDIYYMDLVSIRYSDTKVMPRWGQQPRACFYFGSERFKARQHIGRVVLDVHFFYSPILVWLSLQRMQQAVEWFRAVVNDYTLPVLFRAVVHYTESLSKHVIEFELHIFNKNLGSEILAAVHSGDSGSLWCIARYHL
jgi:hypothetical protein